MKAKRPVLSARLRMALIERRVGREARWRAVRALRRLEPQHECSEFRASYETLGCWVFSVCGSEFQVDLRDMPSKWGCYHSTGREYEYPLQADADELEELESNRERIEELQADIEAVMAKVFEGIS